MGEPARKRDDAPKQKHQQATPAHGSANHPSLYELNEARKKSFKILTEAFSRDLDDWSDTKKVQVFMRAFQRFQTVDIAFQEAWEQADATTRKSINAKLPFVGGMIDGLKELADHYEHEYKSMVKNALGHEKFYSSEDEISKMEAEIKQYMQQVKTLEQYARQTGDPRIIAKLQELQKNPPKTDIHFEDAPFEMLQEMGHMKMVSRFDQMSSYLMMVEQWNKYFQSQQNGPIGFRKSGRGEDKKPSGQQQWIGFVSPELRQDAAMRRASGENMGR